MSIEYPITEYRVKPVRVWTSCIRCRLTEPQCPPECPRFVMLDNARKSREEADKNGVDAGIKVSEKRLRPWTAEEAIWKVVHRKDEPNTFRVIVFADWCGCGPFGDVNISYSKLLEYYIQPDGSPCGVEE